MVKNHHYQTYAIKDGKCVSIEEVESGLKCGCSCSACGKPLIARKGGKRTHHFAHYQGDTCEYGYETSLHLMAKDILSNAEAITTPPVYISFPNSNKGKELYYSAKEIKIDRVELEKRINDIIPDVVVYSGERPLIIEIYVTHRIDDDKLKKIVESGISTIEIDLSKQNKSITREELRNTLCNDTPEKAWKYNARCEEGLKRFFSIADKKRITIRGVVPHVDGCPIPVREWKGKPYANMYDDCLGCKYCISIESDYLLCSGRARISSVSDFSIPIEERIKKSNQELEAQRELNTYIPYIANKLKNDKKVNVLKDKKARRELGFKTVCNMDFESDEIIRDQFSYRWVKCTECNKIKREDEMLVYGGASKRNLGICKDCRDRI